VSSLHLGVDDIFGHMTEMKLNLEGDKVTIRELRIGDIFDVFVNIRDKDIGKLMLPPRQSYLHNSCGRFIYRLLGHIYKAVLLIRNQLLKPKMKKDYKFAIVLKKTERVIGVVTLSTRSQQIRTAELGFWIGRKFWGMGLGTEAVKLVLKLGFLEMNLSEIYALTLLQNIKSRRVLEKCGLRLRDKIAVAGQKDNDAQDAAKYSILKTEFEISEH
jgi:RimJ/RimL family protein N-acetyltransferase